MVVMDKLLGQYKNGNYNVEIYNDGTKIRETSEDKFIPDFPESIDLKITNQCDMECDWCHEESTKDGKHADVMNLDFIDTLPPYIEVALGGGDVLSHPELISFLMELKDKDIIANITVNQTHFLESQGLIDYLIKMDLVKGLGVSINKINENIINQIQQYDNAVVHLINGIVAPRELGMLYDKDLKVLILGYKRFGRGKQFYSNEVKSNMDYLKKVIFNILHDFKVISFDNLAIEQLNLQEKLPQHIWKQFYMGDEGEFTMYIDAVEEEFSVSSTSTKRYKLKDNIKDMFNIIREG